MTMHEKTIHLSSSMSPWNSLENQSTGNKRTNQAIIVHVMDFIMTMIGCIVLNIDHRLNYRSFEKIFTPECLETIRIDLENLLRFEREHVDLFLLALIKIRYANDFKICSRVTINYPFTKHLRKKDIRLEVLRVVNSMIFRRGADTIFLSNDQESCGISSFRIGKNPGRFITDWPCYVEYPRKVRIIAMAEPRRKISSSTDCEVLRVKDQRRCCECLQDIDVCEDIWLKKLLDLKSNFPDRKNEANRLMDRNIIVSEDRTVSGHVCNRINCPLCYGWLWLPICYCVYTFVRIMIDLMHGFINGILGYFSESHVGEVEDA